jgi:hypothetical protein
VFVSVASLAYAQAPTTPTASATGATAAPIAKRPVRGRVEDLGGLTLLRVQGTPAERGYAHGFLLGEQVAAVAIAEFEARFAKQQPLLQMARDAVGRLIEYPEDVAAELVALYAGLVDRQVDLKMPTLGRPFDLVDLQVANALDVFGLMGCSGFTVWGQRVVDGGVLTGRNFDWPCTGPHLVDRTILLVQHLPDGRATASVTWPGYVATVTGVSRDGLAAFLHVGSAKISRTPEPSSWPTAVAARAILEQVGAAMPAAEAIAKAKDLIGYTSPPAGYLTRLVLPVVPQGGAPEVVFETDVKSSVAVTAGDAMRVVTNHFVQRQDGREASPDSRDREAEVTRCLGTCFTGGDSKVSIDEAWAALATVERGNRRFGTLHALVFRHEPWCFELRIGTVGDKGIVPAPSSARRHTLTREQVFPADVVLPAAAAK